MPDWLIWLLPVPVATIAAIAWSAWANRPRGPVEAEESVRAHERFRQALAAPLPPNEEPKTGAGGDLRS